MQIGPPRNFLDLYKGGKHKSIHSSYDNRNKTQIWTNHRCFGGREFRTNMTKYCLWCLNNCTKADTKQMWQENKTRWKTLAVDYSESWSILYVCMRAVYCVYSSHMSTWHIHSLFKSFDFVFSRGPHHRNKKSIVHGYAYKRTHIKWSKQTSFSYLTDGWTKINPWATPNIPIRYTQLSQKKINGR